MTHDNEEKKHYEGHRKRLRERMLENGLKNFSEHEVIELLLQFTYPRIDTKEKAKKVLEYFDGEYIDSSAHKDLIAAKLSETAATLIIAVREAFIYQFEKKIKNRKSYIFSPDDAAEYLTANLKYKNHEEFHIVYLNTANAVLDVELLFTGSINESRVYIRKIIEKCLKVGASQILIAHNHPSGRLKPSNEDISITQKIQEVLKYIEVSLIDHLIIGDNEYLSFRRERII